MGTGFTIDTPLRVARYGITSVISLVDDTLTEQMRRFHSEKAGIPYEEIPSREEDVRARRITAYLNLVDELIQRQVQTLQAAPFEPGSEITRYFEMLPDGPLKQAWRKMLATEDREEQNRLQRDLRLRAVPGCIDVNIMTKLDRDNYRGGKKLPPEFADAMAAMRGYANSTLRSSIVFSAGMNLRLYSSIAQFDDFFPGTDGVLTKQIILKVSDYRSGLIQAKFLAKKGLWVSEYRIESGLNCGGHAFATKGYLLGPILEEFKRKREELIELLHPIYRQALAQRERPLNGSIPAVRITVQGGIGTAAEDRMLMEYYNVDGTGWATPFLLVPDVSNVDESHLNKLLAATTEQDVYLSDASPLGIPFWNLRASASEETRRRRIHGGVPGSPCPKGFLVSNMEFTKVPICHASRAYQKRKLKHLSEEGWSECQLHAVREQVLSKSCICHDLAGNATVKNGIDPNATPSICCGPNIVNFSKIATLEEMIGHIYGRLSLLTNPKRPHMFIRELAVYVDYFVKEVEKLSLGLSNRKPNYFSEFRENLLSGIEYYRCQAEQIVEDKCRHFLDELNALCKTIEPICQAVAG